ncbi:Hydrolase of the alpha/beta superfamily [Streptococcus troglodytae]|uniref:Hydrolase of the alpha/beta superfamily n=1 Tax=Streptococcus troglodytae TaxID=1111760 RepID=A0A1L7LJT2_9STRE|nr:Hydrolase of the alpha/beta superfamily [Streptococcus troglodytae]
MTLTFETYPQIERQSVRFANRYGIELAGDLYLPENYADKKNPALVVTGPFGAVKEQSAGLYAQELATYGFVALAFDPSNTGESGGVARNVASPELFTEDYSAAVDFLGSLTYIDREKIGALGICGLSGMALTAASIDTRIKAVATSVMYDISRSVSEGVGGMMTPEQKENFKDFLAQQRWNLVDGGDHVTGPHEPMFDENNQVIHTHGLPDQLPENPHPVLAAFYDYYKTPRGWHENSVNSTGAWESTTPLPFLAFPQYTAISEIAPRPILFITGEHAHSRYFPEQAAAQAGYNAELVVVPNADHVDLYDKKDLIPFAELADFYTKAFA